MFSLDFRIRHTTVLQLCITTRKGALCLTPTQLSPTNHSLFLIYQLAGAAAQAVGAAFDQKADEKDGVHTGQTKARVECVHIEPFGDILKWKIVKFDYNTLIRQH